MVSQMRSYQSRMADWVAKCISPRCLADRHERNSRFLEEALELVQACGASREMAHQAVDYVFDREVGKREQEVGGVMSCLAALCSAWSIDLDEATHQELERILDPAVMERIRKKHAGKPRFVE